MTSAAQHEITGLLQAWRAGDRAALDRLTEIIYAQLHRLAHGYLRRERPGHTLNTTALINEAYLRLVDANGVDWHDRAHFLAVCAVTMRRVLIQYARSRHARKRSAGAITLDCSQSAVLSPERTTDLLALDEALDELAMADPREAKAVELMFFGGLSRQETAHVLGVAEKTVRRDWDHARAWLLCRLKAGAPS